MISEIEISAALELFEAAPCAYLITLPDGTITKVNQTFLDWTGHASSELVHRKKFQELLTRPSAIFYETHFSPLLRMQGYVKEITIDFLCADGSPLPALVNSKIHADESGNPALILTSMFDIRERRRTSRRIPGIFSDYSGRSRQKKSERAQQNGQGPGTGELARTPDQQPASSCHKLHGNCFPRNCE